MKDNRVFDVDKFGYESRVARDERFMKKVIVIGCPGSGKTTFAEKLNKCTELPLFYLDAIWHKPDRTHISREEYDERLAEIMQLDEWIIDGNYSRTIEMRMKMSDNF